MPVFTDQMGNTVSLSQFPRRIISIVPSQTELLFDLGLEEEVVGITKFCVHPEKWFRTKDRVGGTKQLDRNKIRSLRPDIIIGNKEENTEDQVRELMMDFPVWMSDIKTMEDALDMIQKVGVLVGKNEQSHIISRNIVTAFNNLKPETLNLKPERVLYLIWKDPYMTPGSDTFINSMIECIGLINVFRNYTRYPEITEQQIKDANPEYIFLSSEPYPFKEKHVVELQQIVPGSKIILVDGEMFSWYGSKLLQSPGYFSLLRRSIVSASH